MDIDKKPAVHTTPLNHVGLWIDDLPVAVEWLTAQGVRFAPGGIRKGAAGFDICFLHPKANEEFPIAGEGVLIELVQAPPEVIARFCGPGRLPQAVRGIRLPGLCLGLRAFSRCAPRPARLQSWRACGQPRRCRRAADWAAVADQAWSVVSPLSQVFQAVCPVSAGADCYELHSGLGLCPPAARPGAPAGLRAGDIFQADAVHRAHRHAQLAAGAVGLDHGVHQFVAAEDGIGRAGLDAQGAADAPGFVDDGHGARAFDAMGRVERL